MENQPLEAKNITISGVEILTWGLKVKSEQNLIFNVPQLKKGTQEQTVAYTTLTNLPNNGIGLQKCFKFVSVKNQQGGQSRYVRIISEPEDTPETTQSTTQAPKSSPQPVLGQKTGTDINWDKISWGKCKHAYLVEAFKSIYTSNSALSDADMSKTEKLAEEWADMSMRDTRKPEVQNKLANSNWANSPESLPTEELPTINQEDEIRVDEIPF